MHTHINLWNATRVITWATTRNVRSFLACNYSKGKVGTPPGFWVGKWLGVPLGFNIWNTVVIAFCVYYFIILLFLYLGLQLFSFVSIHCAFVRELSCLRFLSDWHYTWKCIWNQTWDWCWNIAGLFIWIPWWFKWWQYWGIIYWRFTGIYWW